MTYLTGYGFVFYNNCVLIAAIFLLGTGGNYYKALADVATDELLSNARQGWAALDVSYSKVSVTCTVIMESSAREVPPQRLIYRRNQGNRLLEIERSQSAGESDSAVFAINKDYAFKLVKRSASGGKVGEWVINEASSSYAKQKVPVYAVAGLSHGFYESPWKVDRLPPLPDLVTMPGFEIESITPLGLEVEQYVMKCRYQANDQDLNDFRDLSRMLAGVIPVPSFNGEIELSPAMSWAITRYDLVIDSPQTVGRSKQTVRVTGSIDYATKVNLAGEETPVPQAVKICVSSGEGIAENVDIKIESWEFIDLPAAEFTLTAYSLPEVAKVNVNRSRSVSLLAVTAGIFVIAGVLLRRRSADSGTVPNGLS